MSLDGTLVLDSMLKKFESAVRIRDTYLDVWAPPE